MEDLQKIKEFFSKSINEAVDMAELEFELKRIKKENPGKKVTYFFTKDDPKGYKIQIKEFFSKPLEEAKAKINDIKKQLDALDVKYEMSKTDKVRPFKVIYKPVNKSDEFYDKFNNIVDLANLKGVVKTSMNESNGFTSGKQMINIKLKRYPKAVAKVNQLIDMIGEDRFTMEMAEWIWDFFSNAHFERPVNEAKSEDAVDTITMDIPLFLRMLEYSREDASQDMDLHDVTEKANTLGKERGTLTMDDYDAIVGAAEEIDETELSEAYVPSNIKEFAERKGISSLVNKVAGWAEKVGARITGGTAIGKNYDTLILDMGYQTADIYINIEDGTIELYGEPADSFPQFQKAFMNKVTRDEIEKDENQFRREQGLEETLLERVFNRIKNDQSRTKR